MSDAMEGHSLPGPQEDEDSPPTRSDEMQADAQDGVIGIAFVEPTFRILTATGLARRTVRAVSLAIPLCAGVLLLSACAERDDTFLTVQLCVHDADGVEQLKALMRKAAQAENLQFVDRSRETGESLEVMGGEKASMRDPSRAINVGIKSDHTVYVMGGNLGLPSYQVALGFGTGSDPEQARRLS